MVFSGIVEEQGRVVSLTHATGVRLWDGSTGEGWVLVIRARVVLEGAYDGCSIAVNGTCLTVTAFDAETFTVGCAPETMRRTNLIDLAEGEAVNLERALHADGRNSGHLVQGHVDCTGTIEATWREGDSLWVRVRTPPSTLRYIVPKGFIAVDGASLTVCEVVTDPTKGAPPPTPSPLLPSTLSPDILSHGWFTFMLIAYTQTKLTLPHKPLGARVNLEADLQGKLVERILATTLTDALARMEASQAALESRLHDALAGLTARVQAIEARLPPPP